MLSKAGRGIQQLWGALTINAQAGLAALTLNAGTTGLVNEILAGAATAAGVEIAGNGNVAGTTSFFVGQDVVGNAILLERANLQMQIGVNNAPLIYLSGVQVGIGAAPGVGYNLDVAGLMRATTGLYTGGAGAGYLRMVYGATSDWQIQSGIGGTNNLSFRDNVNGASRLVLTATGEAQIGPPVSGVALSVQGVVGTHSTQIDDAAGAAHNAGYLNTPQNAQAAGYTLVLADAGKSIFMDGSAAETLTIPANASVAFEIGTTIAVYNASAFTVTLAINTDTLLWYQGGSYASGSRSLATRSAVTLYKSTATQWIVTGNGLS